MKKQKRTGVRIPFPKFALVMIVGALATVGVALSVSFTAMFFGIPWNNFWASYGPFAFILLTISFGFIQRFFATAFLFPKENAELQILGGAQIGVWWQTLMTAGHCTWPYAKLSADSKSIRLYTPWENFEWSKENPPTKISVRSNGPLAGKLLLVDGDEKISFFIWRWNVATLDSQLRALGYSLS